MKLVGLLVFLILPLHVLQGQVSIEGRVVNTQGVALPNVNILVYPPNSRVLVAFAVSNQQGFWRTTVNLGSDSLDIEATSINHRNIRKRIANIAQTLTFEMMWEATDLEGLTVRAPSVVQRGDTISLLVSAFAQEQHRSIADVLRAMPGLEVEPSGRILYQGMPIIRFYVEGLDLMGGRYTMVSNNLPHRAVATVEILENHQPVRILEKRVPSYQAALNLRLKREVTTTGTAKLGAGHGPLLWDANITPMTFTDRFQVVNAYQANNAGRDAANQLRALTFDGLRNRQERPRDNPELLGLQSLTPPDFNTERFLDNNIHLLNSNALLRLDNELQLRANIHYISDNQRQRGLAHRTLYSPADTLHFAESLENRVNDSYLQGEITLKRNVPENFLNNILRFNRRWDSSSGMLNINNHGISQKVNNPFRNISNELRSINQVGPHLVQFNSFISIDHSPQQLVVSPGRFEQVLAGGDAIAILRQNTDLRRIFVDHSAGFTFSWRGLSIGPRLGFSFRRQNLESNLYHYNAENWFQAPRSFGNQLVGRQSRAYLDTELIHRRGNLSLTANLPLSWQQLKLEDIALQQGQSLNRLLFDPRFSADYQISGFWRVRGSVSLTTRLGDMDGIHYGYILTNHRNLQQNAAPIPETQSQNFSAFISYRNPIESFFNSLSYIFSRSTHSLLYSNLTRRDGTSIVEALEIPNTGFTHNLSGQSSKLIRPLGTTISLRISYNFIRRQSLFNEQLFETSNRFISVVPQMNTRITEWLRTEYRANLTNMQTYIAETRGSNVRMLRHFFDFHIFPLSGHYVGLTTEFYRHRNNDNFFADILYRFTIERHRLDIEARWSNIFNTDTYTTFQASAFSVLETTYFLRPSQVQVSVRFRF
ncbi:MAG TPA: hypothetical protein DCM62_09170 [Bacteroidales bacterium]|nr:hypothetical protein [Bacteroidales bacterium]